jgi:hypothetical protein
LAVCECAHSIMQVIRLDYGNCFGDSFKFTLYLLLCDLTSTGGFSDVAQPKGEASVRLGGAPFWGGRGGRQGRSVIQQ